MSGIWDKFQKVAHEQGLHYLWNSGVMIFWLFNKTADLYENSLIKPDHDP